MENNENRINEIDVNEFDCNKVMNKNRFVEYDSADYYQSNCFGKPCCIKWKVGDRKGKVELFPSLTALAHRFGICYTTAYNWMNGKRKSLPFDVYYEN